LAGRKRHSDTRASNREFVSLALPVYLISLTVFGECQSYRLLPMTSGPSPSTRSKNEKRVASQSILGATTAVVVAKGCDFCAHDFGSAANEA
jgi:hypothetical protein